jgi:hypothetical protein
VSDLLKSIVAFQYSGAEVNSYGKFLLNCCEAQIGAVEYPVTMYVLSFGIENVSPPTGLLHTQTVHQFLEKNVVYLENCFSAILFLGA